MSYCVTDIVADLCDTWEENVLPSVLCCFPVCHVASSCGSPTADIREVYQFSSKKKKKTQKNRIHKNLVLLVINKLLYNSLDVYLMHL